MKTGRPRKDTSQGLPKRVYLKSGSFYYVHHDARWEKLGKDLDAARKVADGYNSGASTHGTIGHWLDTWLLDLKAKVKAGALAQRTADDYTGYAPHLKAFFGAMAPAQLETHHVCTYLELGRDNERPVQANREKAALSSCVSWMIHKGHAGLKANPCKGAPRNPETPRDRYITDDEYVRVLTLCGPAERAWGEMMYQTLQRPSDILAWTKKTIVDEGAERYLVFRQSKTGKHMKIRVSPTLQASLDALAAERPGVKSLYLIPREDGKPYTETGIASMFRRATVEAGVDDFAPYDLKAKAATDMHEAGVPMQTICDLCGHDSVRTTEIYIKRHQRKTVEPNQRKPSKTA